MNRSINNIICVLHNTIMFAICFSLYALTKDENIYRSITAISWYDKPQWFKKCLLLMITRANKKIEVKPYGLYVVNLRNFSKVMNAAYSYFNLISNITKNRN
ncbi:odorant receptor 43a-like isoform X2 [Lycorma delicatula]|uniref:odorant receptor 43a-like isoform X2 n=1 Tax=Lycorma delicatula TaxID=130591 RepID=UPI003F5127D0